MQTITTKKLTAALIVVLCCVMGLIPVIAFSHSIVAEELPQLIVEEQINANGDTIYHVQGIKEYLFAPQTRAADGTSRLHTLLRTLQYTDEQIAVMPEERKQAFAEAEEVYVASATATQLEEVNSGTQTAHKLTICTRVIRTENIIWEPNGPYYIYRLLGEAEYEQSTGQIPVARGKDAMLFSWKGALYTLDIQKLGTMIVDQYSLLGSYKGTFYEYMGVSENVTEYNGFSKAWGMHYDLPNDTLVSRYGNFKFCNDLMIAAGSDFMVYNFYAHCRTTASTANVTIDEENGYVLDSGTCMMTYAPDLYIQIPR